MKKFLPKTKNNTQGFTLVELLVVIAIIAILSVIGVTVFSGVQKNARDAKRKADVEAIVAALETNYNATTNTYPTSISDGYFASGTQPKDPSNNTSNYQITGGGSANICVCTAVALENGGNNFTNNTCTTAGTALYCKKGSQI